MTVCDILLFKRMSVSSSTHVECRCYLSCNVELDVLAVVSKLSFPLVGLGKAVAPRDGDLRFTASISCHGEPLHKVSVSTSSRPRRLTGKEGEGRDHEGSSDKDAYALLWDEVITFPVKV